jgi:hypothetical protein
MDDVDPRSQLGFGEAELAASAAEPSAAESIIDPLTTGDTARFPCPRPPVRRSTLAMARAEIAMCVACRL